MMWTAWPVLQGASKQSATRPLRNRSPLSTHRLSAYLYCMRTNFFDKLSDRFVQGLDVFSEEVLSEWHKLLLIKFLTIHGKWLFSVTMVWAGPFAAFGGLPGNSFAVWVNIQRERDGKEHSQWTVEQGRICVCVSSWLSKRPAVWMDSILQFTKDVLTPINILLLNIYLFSFFLTFNFSLKGCYARMQCCVYSFKCHEEISMLGCQPYWLWTSSHSFVSCFSGNN